MKEQDIRKLLALKLRDFRLRAGLTAKQVGEKIGKSEKTVSGWEHGRGQPDADMLFTLCEIYNVTNIASFYNDHVNDDPAMFLLPDEEELLRLYRMLNPETKTVLIATARGFAGNPAMQKEDTSSAMA